MVVLRFFWLPTQPSHPLGRRNLAPGAAPGGGGRRRAVVGGRRCMQHLFNGRMLLLGLLLQVSFDRAFAHRKEVTQEQIALLDAFLQGEDAQSLSSKRCRQVADQLAMPLQAVSRERCAVLHAVQCVRQRTACCEAVTMVVCCRCRLRPCLLHCKKHCADLLTCVSVLPTCLPVRHRCWRSLQSISAPRSGLGGWSLSVCSAWAALAAAPLGC